MPAARVHPGSEKREDLAVEQLFQCHVVSPGGAEGRAMLSEEPVLFYCTDPETGRVTEPGHCLNGRSVRDRILVFPGGKGSSVVQMDGLYRLDREGTAPKGFIVRELDTVLVSAAVIMEIPMVDRVEESFYEAVRDGDLLRIDTERGLILLDREEG